jgi:uncharacterized membrane protein YbhN (UPF0104 family)
MITSDLGDCTGEITLYMVHAKSFCGVFFSKAVILGSVILWRSLMVIMGILFGLLSFQFYCV